MTEITDQILTKVRNAAEGHRAALSTGEALIAALVLDRPDWLADMRYTVAEALDRIGPKWAAAIPQLARTLAENDAVRASRYTWSIQPSTDPMGTGFHLQIFECGNTVFSRTFRTRVIASGNARTDVAYADAVAAAHAWLDAQPNAVPIAR